MAGTPIEKLRKANDDLHEAVNEILTLGDYTVEQKCEVGQVFAEAFENINHSYKILEG